MNKIKNKEPLVSIVIPTFNSGKTLGICLNSIKNQTYKNIEVIIVDKFSEDETVEIARMYGAKVIQCNAEMSEARNIGLYNISKEAEFVMFIDSDMELTPNVVYECVKLMEGNENLGMIIIPEKTIGNNLLAKIREFERSFYYNTEIEAARFFRVNIAKKVEGYDKDIIFYEDHTLPQKIERLGYKKDRINAFILHHEENLTLFKHLKKKIYYGKTIAVYKRRYQNYASEQINIFYRIMIFLKNRRFYSKPLLAIGVIILKSLEFFAIILGFILEKLKISN